MHCTRCGSPLPPGATSCPNCGQPVPVPAAYAAPVVAATIPNYLVQAILVTLCCGCGLPFGIVAIVYSSQVNNKVLTGDVEGAVRAASNAKMWCWIAAGVGVLTYLICLIFFGAGIAQAIRNAH